MSETSPIYSPPPALLSTAELAEIKRTANNAYEGRISSLDLAKAYTDDVDALLAHIEALAPSSPTPEAAGEMGELSLFGQQMVVMLEIAGPWTGDHAPNFSDLLAVVLKKYRGLEAERCRISPLLSAAPALLTPDQLAAITDALAGERQSCADEPAHPLGYWPTAVAALLGHATQMAEELDDQKAYGNQGIDHELELMRHLKIVKAERDETARELSYERQMRQQTEEAMMKLGRRVLEQQAELAEQEKQTLLLLKERAAHKNSGRFPLCLICENGPALCECSPLPKKKK